MAQQVYATREDVRSALGSASTARSDAQVDRALVTATRSVDNLCQRTLAPRLATFHFDWPQEQTPRSWRLWLDQYDLITPTQILSAGVEVPATDYYLEPANEGPPYRLIETRLDQPSVWTTGGTWQHAIAVTGWWGYSDEQTPAGTLAADVSSTTTTSVTVSDSSAVGVGHLITVGAERMQVTDKALVDTGQTGTLTATKGDVALAVADGTAYHRDEILTLDAERIKVIDIAGNTLSVERAVDGTALAAHTSAALWAPRLLTVVRGAAGTTAATATSGTAVTRWVPPGDAQTLTVGEAMVTLANEQAVYARTVRAGSSSGRSVAVSAVELDGLRARVAQQLGRQVRMRVV